MADAACSLIRLKQTRLLLNPYIEPDEECPICLDNYTLEPCVQIINIDGCVHRIGYRCLRYMLGSHSKEEKKCPLCRTVWVAASQNPGARRHRNSASPAISSEDMHAMLADLDGLEEHIANELEVQPMSNARATRPSRARRSQVQIDRDEQNHVSLTVRTENRTAQNPIIVDSDSDDYETQVQNYQDLTRDIADVRTRARNTQLPCSRRHRVLARQRTTYTAPSQTVDSANNASGTEGDATATSGTGHMNRFLSRSRNPFRPTGNGSGRLPATLLDGREHVETIPTCDDSRSTGHGLLRTPITRRISSNRQTASASSSADVEMSESTEQPQTQNEATRDTLRTRRSDRRESALNNREHIPRLREEALVVRERALVAEETRGTRIATILRAQQEELQKLLRRHQEERERMMG